VWCCGAASLFLRLLPMPICCLPRPHTHTKLCHRPPADETSPTPALEASRGRRRAPSTRLTERAEGIGVMPNLA